jgi:type I restriction enzyme S subunit
VKSGDILFSTVRTYLRNIAIVSKTYHGQIASTGFCVIRPSNSINNKFVFYHAQTEGFLNPLTQLQRGTSYPAVRDSDVFDQVIPLPPLAEQKRIVAKIEELFTKLDAGVEGLKSVKAQLKRYRQAVLKFAFEGKLTEKWREENKDKLEPASVLLERIKEERKKNLGKKYKGLPPVDTSDLPELPEGWTWTRVREIAALKNGINFNKGQKGDSGILTVDVLNMYSKSIFVDMRELYRVNKSVKEDYLLKYGDILFVRSSVKREGVGWASTFREYTEPVTFCGFIIRARLLSKELIPEYLTYFLRTDSARGIIVGKGSQVTITNISQESLGGVLLPIPPNGEQREIVWEIERRFSVADEVEKVVEQSLKQAERLRQSILKGAFEGKLVPQDPTDEPAEKLLERIKVEKVKMEAENRENRKRTKRSKQYAK